ncbi:Adenosine receptor A2b [Lamellibrachia satsuma]|nr:Adenosine receptor A2b [Lamellibrachia satsuma]
MNASTGNETNGTTGYDDGSVELSINGAYCVFVLLGNGMTIASVLRFEQLRTPTNLFIASLAAADFAVGLNGTFYSYLVKVPAGIRLSRTSQSSCVFSLCGILFSTLGSVFNLLAISVDRFLAITLPLRYKAVVTMRAAQVCTAVIWSVILCLSLPPVFGWNRWSGETRCSFSEVLYAEYTFGLFIFPIVACLIVLTAEQPPASYSVMKGHLKSTKIMCIVLGAFYLCWCPYIVISVIIASKKPNISEVLGNGKRLASFLVLINSGMNPCIYAWRDAEFRKVYKKLLRFT